MSENFHIETLIKEIKQDNEKAFEQLYGLFHDKLLFYSLRFLKSHHLAEEAVQETFVKLWYSRKNLDEYQNCQGLIFTICRNIILNFIQRAKHEKKICQEIIHASTQSYEQIECWLNQKHINEFIHQAIAQLPAQRQLIFKLVKFEKMSYEEVAAKLNISKGTISDHVVKANKFISRYILSHGKSRDALMILAIRCFCEMT